MHGKYTLNTVGETQFQWNLNARDAQTLLSSEVFADKASAETAIAACRASSADDACYERLTAQDKRACFALKSADGELIGRSQMYPTDRAREMGIAACKETGPRATIKYEMRR